jgi:hypothetical protein
MKKLQAKLTIRKSDEEKNSNEADDDIDDEARNDYDEEEVKQELEARLAFSSSSNRGREKSRATENLVLLDVTRTAKNCFKISDFPEAMEPGDDLIDPLHFRTFILISKFSSKLNTFVPQSIKNCL